MAKKIKLIVGSTRQGRIGITVADWLVGVAKNAGVELEVLDLKEVNLPKFDSAISPMYAAVDTPDAKAWAAQIAEADGLIFLTSEYNRSIPASLKDAIDYLYTEWNGKKAGIVSYGWIDGGASATKHLTDILNWVKIELVEPNIAVKFDGETFNESGQFKDINTSLGAIRQDFLSQLKAVE